MVTKKCTKCGEVKQLTEYAMCGNTNKRRAQCKKCTCKMERNKVRASRASPYKKPVFVVDSLLLDFSSRYARIPRSAKSIRITGNVFTKMSIDMDANLVLTMSNCVSLVSKRLFGHPTGVTYASA